jgi:hypothetical protein
MLPEAVGQIPKHSLLVPDATLIVSTTAGVCVLQC